MKTMLNNNFMINTASFDSNYTLFLLWAGRFRKNMEKQGTGKQINL